MISPATGWVEHCAACGGSWPVPTAAWRCDCGGLLSLDAPPASALVGDESRWSMWRYSPLLPPLEAWEDVTLGEGMTPVVSLGDGVAGKVDYLNPTLSFKDRGAVLLVTAAVALGARTLVVDSSGNAGTAVAAYAARAGLAAEIFVPAATSEGKLAAMRAHGATVKLVAGDRAAAATGAARRVEETGAYYASHVYQPLFVHGVKTFVLELWEQLGGLLPATLIVPAGNGTLVSGYAHAVADLISLGLIDHGPRLVAVQAASCAPLAGRAPSGPTIAEGIAIATPPRGAEVIAAVQASGGAVVTVGDGQIAAARADLAARGLWVEPTAAAAWAAWRAGLARSAPGATPGPGATPAPGVSTASGVDDTLRPGLEAVVMLCGAGLKHPGTDAPSAPTGTHG